ncbi:hypothetical protein KC339_g10686 [Hortaea werneckii]|nr:hypothetical protein KC339_g10686 [Hortaea werneckii]
MSPPLTALFEEATCNVCAWNNALLPDEQYQRLYQEIMTSDVALNPTCTPTYPQEVASLTQSPDMYPSQTTFGWDLNDKLQGIEGQKDLAHSGPAQMERPGLTEHAMHDLRHHQRVHKPRRFICETCNKAFHYFKDLRRHWKIHNVDPKQKFYCPFTTCKHHCQGFNRDDHLRRHMEKQHQHVDSALQQSSGGLASV